MSSFYYKFHEIFKNNIKTNLLADYLAWILIFAFPILFMYVGYNTTLATIENIFNYRAAISLVFLILIYLYFNYKNNNFIRAYQSSLATENEFANIVQQLKVADLYNEKTIAKLLLEIENKISSLDFSHNKLVDFLKLILSGILISFGLKTMLSDSELSIEKTFFILINVSLLLIFYYILIAYVIKTFEYLQGRYDKFLDVETVTVLNKEKIILLNIQYIELQNEINHDKRKSN